MPPGVPDPRSLAEPAPLAFRWLPAEMDADEGLAALVREHWGNGDIAVGRRCPRCQSASHGMPWARHSGRPACVSVSRSGPHLLVAVRTDGGGALGVDVESIAEANSRLRPEDALHPDDAVSLVAWPADERRARAWVAKEAILKAEGTALTTDPRSVALRAHPVRWLPAPPGYVAAAFGVGI